MLIWVAYGWADDATVAADALGRTAWDLRRLALDAKRVSLADANQRHQDRYLRTRWDHDGGGVRIDGWLPGAEGKLVETALLRGAESQPDEPDRDHRRRIGERMADALIEQSSAVLGADADPDRATVVVHVDAHALAGDMHTPPRWLRRRVLHRDGACRWTGCERTALLHIHHIRWWTRGRPRKRTSFAPNTTPRTSSPRP